MLTMSLGRKNGFNRRQHAHLRLTSAFSSSSSACSAWFRLVKSLMAFAASSSFSPPALAPAAPSPAAAPPPSVLPAGDGGGRGGSAPVFLKALSCFSKAAMYVCFQKQKKWGGAGGSGFGKKILNTRNVCMCILQVRLF